MMRMPSSEMFNSSASCFDLRAVAQKDGRAEPQRIKLARRLQHARLRAFRKNNPFGMPLQFFNDVADETHGAKLAAIGESAIVLAWPGSAAVPAARIA